MSAFKRRGGLSVLLVPEDDGPVVQFRMSRRAFRAVVWCAGLVVFSALAGLGGWWWALRQNAKVRELERENAQLRETSRKVEELADALAQVYEFRRRLVVALGGREPEDSLSAILVRRFRTSKEPEPPSRVPEAMAAAREEARYHPSIWPVSGWISRRFDKNHKGIDIAGVHDDTVRATAEGVVKFAGRKGDLGLSVVLEHGGKYRTVYGHCRKLLVKKGQKVAKGQAIALLGSTGHSTGVHLHYEVWKDGKAVDPEKFLIER